MNLSCAGILKEPGVEEFFKAPQPNMTLTNHFYKSQYLLPISASELEKTPQIIQNPFY